MFSPSVITSKPASQELEKIKGIHADLLTGMANHSIKVANFKQNKQAEFVQQNLMKMEMDREKMTADTVAQKNANDFSLKQAELDIKRVALSAV